MFWQILAGFFGPVIGPFFQIELHNQWRGKGLQEIIQKALQSSDVTSPDNPNHLFSLNSMIMLDFCAFFLVWRFVMLGRATCTFWGRFLTLPRFSAAIVSVRAARPARKS
jgi:hypothetical protein